MNVPKYRQIIADIMTFEEAKGPIAGRRVAWTGDGNDIIIANDYGVSELYLNESIGRQKPW